MPPIAEEEAEAVATGVALQGLDFVALVAVPTTAGEELSVPDPDAEAAEDVEESVPVDTALELDPEPEEDEEVDEPPTINLVQSSCEPRLAIELSTG